jgi:phosphosulfolactate synthase
MEIRTGLVDELVIDIPQEDILWEAPLKDQQAWFIKKFGPTVNLGNISPRAVLPLETLRRGLRSDTLCHFHGGTPK